MQEFCLFAVVGLVSDFFLQMFFFTTVLSIDIRRMEVSLTKKKKVVLCYLTEELKAKTPHCVFAQFRQRSISPLSLYMYTHTQQEE